VGADNSVVDLDDSESWNIYYMGMMKRLIILGAPGVGKGTQAARLGADFGWAHISTGDMLRDAVRQGLPLGQQAKDYMDRGELVPDDLMVELVGERIRQADCRGGFILDGFPRTVVQAQKLDYLLKASDLTLDDVINIDVSQEEIVQRLSHRLVCETCGYVATTTERMNEGDKCPSCGQRLIRRRDDQPDTIRNRLEVYESQTRSLIEYYKERGVLKDVDGLGSMDEVYSRILSALGISSVNT